MPAVRAPDRHLWHGECKWLGGALTAIKR